MPYRVTINKLSTANLRGDLFGGITAAVIALPLALAFGVASGMGPIAGLYGAICVGLFASLFGGTPSQISGPTGPMTIVCASIFATFSDRPAIAFTIVIMAGGFQVLLVYLRIGRYVNLMPYPVISGFMTGIGCILIIMQLEPMIGHATPASVVSALELLPEDLQTINWNAMGIGVLSLAICLFTPQRIARAVPSPLLALLICTFAAMPMSNVPVLGAVPSGLPDLQLPRLDFGDLNYILVSSAVLAALGSIDTLLTSLVADNMSRGLHDSDKELVGQGIGNIAAGFAGGLPGAGATVRTLANIKAGGRTPLSGVTHAVLLFLVAIGLGPIVAWVPHAALAGILFKVGIDVIDWRFIRRWHRAPRGDLVLTVVVLALTVFVDVITAVGVGIVLASLMFVKAMADLQVKSISTIVDEEHEHFLEAPETDAFRACLGRAAILHMSGAMSFGAANEMMRRIAVVRPVDVLIIDLTAVPSIDGSAALALEELVQRALDNGQEALVAGMQLPVARMLGRLGALDKLKETTRFPSRLDAIRRAAQIVAERQESRAA